MSDEFSDRKYIGRDLSKLSGVLLLLGISVFIGYDLGKTLFHKEIFESNPSGCFIQTLTQPEYDSLRNKKNLDSELQ